MGKNYLLRSHHIKRLITHVEKGGVLEGHKDVPEAVRDKLYSKNKRDRRDWGKTSAKEGMSLGLEYLILLAISSMSFPRNLLPKGS
jgi:hypothetical protein